MKRAEEVMKLLNIIKTIGVVSEGTAVSGGPGLHISFGEAVYCLDSQNIKNRLAYLFYNQEGKIPRIDLVEAAVMLLRGKYGL